MRLTKIFHAWFLLVCLVAAAPASASTSDEASSFISDLGQKALTIIRSQEGLPERRAEFSKLFATYFDVSAIGRFALGRYWRTSSPEQQTRYLDLFGRYVIAIYSDRFSNYSGEEFEVLGSQPTEGGAELVSSQITHPSGGKPIHIDWRVKPQQDGLKITDVVIEGVSMTVTQRQEFSSIIMQNNGNIEGLLDLLQKKAGDN